MLSKEQSIVIVGAGVFGLSIADELANRGYINITILDRFSPPVPDGSSVDISRIIRFDYADSLYMKMAREAHALWISDFKQHYHGSGFLLVSDNPGHPYLEKAKQYLKEQGTTVDVFTGESDVKNAYPKFQGDTIGLTGYHNRQGGWAHSSDAIQTLASRCDKHGVSFVTGSRGTVTSLKTHGNRVRGVNVKSGPPILADRVILASGAWTSRLVDLELQAIHTAQPVGYIQLTASEADHLREMPVAMNLGTGFFVFPPSPGSNVLKCARHGFGYETTVPVKRLDGESKTISGPHIRRNGATASFMPADAEESLRQGLRRFFPPSVSERTFVMKRLCWYTDTPTGDFIVDNHPALQHLFVATGGSGHAFKFLPVLGKYLADVFEGIAESNVQKKWSIKPGPKDRLMLGDGSRGGPSRRHLAEWEQAKL
ncbi:FAD dependent oxidoreductase [Polychaeton citri CBS 116435]|uniref:FAD dependent oxidoreductase n=1 Tax=Polychaeton citri CBS 116435 TaxID=1314669 RepID=A0A9P4Q3R8_9PEZI|nr:FAD dependent oxidoreductase [Polychaeton citri CBS 116435]